MRINPQTNGPHRAPPATGITLRAIATGAERKVPVPADARIGGVSFSPDGKRFAFTNTREDAHRPAIIADVATGARAWSRGADQRPRPARANGWTTAGGCCAASSRSAARCRAGGARRLPAGPNIQENHGNRGPVRTYQDLLTSAHDEALFEYYFTSQLAFVDAAPARRTPVGKPGMIAERQRRRPTGSTSLVEQIKRPFSRLVPWIDFPADVEVWTRSGEQGRARSPTCRWATPCRSTA